MPERSRLALVEGALPIIFLGVVLKIPVFFAIWLVWWASKSYDEFADEQSGGAEDHGFRRWRRQPKTPRGPRRGGPHGGTEVAIADCPPGGRTRSEPTRRPARQRVSA
jgi:hypothetical protein